MNLHFFKEILKCIGDTEFFAFCFILNEIKFILQYFLHLSEFSTLSFLR